MADEYRALIKTAFAIDKTQFYYNFDENNIAANDYPIGVIGGEQRFDFPTVYFARKKANTLEYEMALDKLESKKRQITRDASLAYYHLVYLVNKQERYKLVDSIYGRFTQAAEVSYGEGEIRYLEMLNARSKHQEVGLLLSQLRHDIDMGYSDLKTMMQFDSAFSVPGGSLEKLLVRPDSISHDPGFHYLQNSLLKQGAELSVERNSLLPEVTLNYFNGTNKYQGARHYQGLEVGFGVPLFFGEQRAKVKAKQIAMEATLSLQTHYTRNYENKVLEMLTGLKKYQEAIEYYEKSGNQLASELIRSSQISFETGEIDLFRFVQSMESAIQIEVNYLNNLHKYNELVLKINYMTIEN